MMQLIVATNDGAARLVHCLFHVGRIFISNPLSRRIRQTPRVVVERLFHLSAPRHCSSVCMKTSLGQLLAQLYLGFVGGIQEVNTLRDVCTFSQAFRYELIELFDALVLHLELLEEFIVGQTIAIEHITANDHGWRVVLERRAHGRLEVLNRRNTRVQMERIGFVVAFRIFTRSIQRHISARRVVS